MSCSQCHRPLASGLRLEGLCPRCLLLLGMGADLPVYRSVGPFELLAEIGRGGMGVVFKAYQTRLHRVVALKILPDSMAREKTYLARFEREARAAASLNHPNTVAVYDVGSDNGTHYMAMEYVDGPNLQELLDRQGPMEWTEALRIVQQALRGLAVAHRAGLVHRDIKPHNIMIGGAGLVKVADFGLAKWVDETAATMTQAGFVVGSPAYMAPEQTRGDDLDGRTDLFAMGSVLYTLLTGRPPFQGNSQAELIQKILFAHPTSLQSLHGGLPLPVVRLVERAMEKNPDDRFASAEEMEKVVGAILSGADATRLLQRISGRPWWHRPRAAIVTAISVLLVAAIVLTYSIRGTRPGAREETRPKTERAARQSAEVAFADSRLEEHVRKALNLAAGQPLDDASFARLTRLDALDAGITDLRGIERATALANLNLSGNPITDLAPLEGMTSLVEVDLFRIPGLDGNELSHLRGLPGLISLHFEGKSHVNEALEIAASLPVIELLTIDGGSSGGPAGIRHLSKARTLRGLSLMNFRNPMADAFQAVGELSELGYLNCTKSNITSADVSRLSGLHRLRFLALGSTRVDDDGCATLAALPGLEILLLDETSLTDAGLTGLAASSSLDYICLAECRRISDSGVEALAGARSLTTLNLLGCPGVTSKGIEGLARAPLLHELHLGRGPAENVAGLSAAAKLPSLSHLVLRPGRPLMDSQVNALLEFKTLRFLGIPEDRIGAGHLERLRESLPDCEIVTRLESLQVHRYSGPN